MSCLASTCTCAASKGPPTLVLVDELQAFYGQDRHKFKALWMCIKSLMIGQGQCNVRIVGAALFGNDPSGRPVLLDRLSSRARGRGRGRGRSPSSRFTTPFEILPQCVVSLRPTEEMAEGLALPVSEYNELFEATWRDHPLQAKLFVGTSTRDIIMEFSGGYVSVPEQLSSVHGLCAVLQPIAPQVIATAAAARLAVQPRVFGELNLPSSGLMWHGLV